MMTAQTRAWPRGGKKGRVMTTQWTSNLNFRRRVDAVDR